MNLPVLAVILLILTSSGLLISRDWRWIVALLACQYAGVFYLVSLDWPVGLAIIKLVTGWMAGVALGLTQFGAPPGTDIETAWPSSRAFRLLASAFLVVVAVSAAPALARWLPGVSNEQALGGLILAAAGLLQIGMTGIPFRVTVGLLTILAGFEILYAAVETSVLVAGLLSAVNLGLALAGAYLVSVSSMPEAG